MVRGWQSARRRPPLASSVEAAGEGRPRPGPGCCCSKCSVRGQNAAPGFFGGSHPGASRAGSWEPFPEFTGSPTGFATGSGLLWELGQGRGVGTAAAEQAGEELPQGK